MALCDHSLMLITSPCVVSLTWTLADAQGATLDELTDPVEFFYGGDDLLAKVEKADIIDGSKVKAGDVLVGIASSGVHSNGYSLVRKILEVSKADLKGSIGGKPLADVLMAPTRIYIKPLLALIKAMPVVADDGELILALVRGDHRLNEIKLANHLGQGVRQARPEEIEAKIGPVGFVGPVGADVRILMDEAIAGAGLRPALRIDRDRSPWTSRRAQNRPLPRRSGSRRWNRSWSRRASSIPTLSAS